MNTPNLFSLATSELSQDAVLAYLVQWSDFSYKESHPQHFALGVELLQMLVGERAKSLSIGHVKIEVGCQDDHVDAWVYIGNQAVLIIEDKTTTFEHGDQIARYIRVASKWEDPDKKKWGPDRVLAAYVKTGNESLSALPQAEDVTKVNRGDLLAVLNRHRETKDDIIDQFRQHLQRWEDETNAYKTQPVSKWEWRAVEGFYKYLERAFAAENIPVKNWHYVSNPAGGFLAFYWGWQYIQPFRCQLYLQIEHATRLQIRVSDAKDAEGQPIPADANLRWQLLHRLQELSPDDKYKPVTVKKSGTYRPGSTGGVAYVEDCISCNPDGVINLETTFQNLKLVMELLAEASS